MSHYTSHKALFSHIVDLTLEPNRKLIGMQKEDVSVGITAFIDILGFGNRVLAANSLNEISSIESDVQKIQSAFDFEPKDELTQEVQKIHNSTVLAFSDCVVVNIPLDSQATRYQGDFDAILSEIVNFAYGQAECCMQGLFIRGGLDLGWWFNDRHTLISKSMVNAYKTEGAASVPVIALTEDVYKHFHEHEDRGNYHEDIEPVTKLFRQYNDGEREFFYIDYISICLEAVSWHHGGLTSKILNAAPSHERQKMQNEGYLHNTEQWLIRHSEKICEGYHATDENSVQQKYVWLSNYHNEIAKGLTENPACFCNCS